jgi:hypothetical protein
MPLNVLEYPEIWTTALDQQAEQGATTGWMGANSGQIQHEGGKKVKVPTIYTDGLGDYARGTGAGNRGKYPAGAVEIKYTDYELEIDRGKEFAWDRHDFDESGFIMSAPTVMGTFQTEHVIPEIDAYRYSKIASLVMAQGAAGTYYHEETLTADNILQRFIAEVILMQDETGMAANGLLATMPFPIFGLLQEAVNNSKKIAANEYTGALNFVTTIINNIPIMPVVSERMKTSYIFHDGEADSGFEPDDDAKGINWIIQPLGVPIAISKTDILKVFTPDANQNGDDWLVQYRKYHDLWIMKNRLNQIVLSVNKTEPPTTGSGG